MLIHDVLIVKKAEQLGFLLSCRVSRTIDGQKKEIEEFTGALKDPSLGKQPDSTKVVKKGFMPVVLIDAEEEAQLHYAHAG
jgi:hypothetical protein